MKIRGVNLTAICVALIIGLSIFGYGLLNFISKENERTNQAEIQRKEQLERSSSLDKCLDEAQSEFERLRNLNSVSDPKPDYPDARKWNSQEVAESITAKLEKAKELCAKLYGSK